MQHTQHTPGPWHINLEDHEADIHSDFGMVAKTMGHGKEQDDEGRANARLIAAAPELLQELLNIANADTVEWDDRSEFEAWAKNRARAAIAKAIGGVA